jgi:hypothetical protein
MLYSISSVTRSQTHTHTHTHQLGGTHSLVAILTKASKYEANHGNKKFVRPKRLPLYDDTIVDNATTVIQVRAEAAHKSRLNDFASYKAAKLGVT